MFISFPSGIFVVECKLFTEMLGMIVKQFSAFPVSAEIWVLFLTCCKFIGSINSLNVH
jgi:hypothetical protein